MSDQKKLNRRDFLKGAAISGAGLAAVGALGASSTTPVAAQVATPAPTPTSAVQYGRPGIDDVPVAATPVPAPTSVSAIPVIGEKELACDVLVIGMGLAGLCAANEAVDLGVKVTLIEKLPKGYWVPGGCVVVSGQSVHLAGLSLMTPEAELTERIRRNTVGRAPEHMVRAYVGNAHRAIEWIKGCGVQFEGPAGSEMTLKPKKPLALNPYQWGYNKPGGKYDATNYGGKINSEVLLSRLERLGATLLVETPAKKLLTNNKGEVVGAVVKTKEGYRDINAKAVIICTGGMLQNQEMMARYFGAHSTEVLPYVTPGATGDGFEMVREIGAGFRNPTLGGGLRPIPEDAIWNKDHLFNNVKFLGYFGIMVDEYGNRVFDESWLSEQKMTKHHIMKHTETVTGMVVCDKVVYDREANVRETIDRVLEFVGTVYKANTIEEIAEQAQKDTKLGPRLGRQQDLVTTVKAFNKALAEGKNMEMRPSRQGNLDKIEKPPIYAIPFTLMSETFLGGLLVNDKSNVIDKDGGVIPGLFAAGELIHGSIGGGPLNDVGTGVAYAGDLGICVVFGMISGESAAKYAKAVA